MYYVYIIQSSAKNNLYVGYSNNLRRRFFEHNAGIVRSTQKDKPWFLVYYEAYRSQKDATKREKELKKMHAAKNKLKEQIKNSLYI